MRSAAAAALCCALLAGCAPAPVAPPQPMFNDALFAPPSERVGAEELFRVSDEMHRYLDEVRGRAHANGLRQALVDAVVHGQLRLDYDASRTRTAAEAFAARSGNCLSLVVMTAALAKELGLDVQYQVAALGDTWSRSGNVYFLNGHVNVTLGKGLGDPRTVYDAAALLTIDFLPGQDLRGLRTRAIDETTVVAMYLNNRAAEAMVRGRLDDAYWWARAAVERAPSFLTAQNTLGVVYLRRGALAEAQAVFANVVTLEPQNTRALANLALVLERQGRHADAAARYAELARLEGEAPFHFFHAGLAAMEAGDFGQARSHFTREAARLPYSHEVHFWLAQAHFRLGELDAARRALAHALEHSTTPREHDLYDAKLGLLRTYAR